MYVHAGAGGRSFVDLPSKPISVVVEAFHVHKK